MMDHSFPPLLAHVSARYPELSFHSVEPITGEGQYNDILLVNGSLIFRFPKFEEGIKNLLKEIRLLPRIQGMTTLPVPDPVYHSGDAEKQAEIFMGYRALPGRPLWRETLHDIKDKQACRRMAAQLGQFLKELHQLSLEKQLPDFPVNDSLAEAGRLYGEVRDLLFRHMRPDAREEVAGFFESYLDSPGLHVYPRTLIHGDFGGSNILFDRDKLEITGIIDFGFSALGDPAVDLAAVSTYGNAFFDLVLETYPASDAALARARFYRGTFALYEAVYGAKHGDEEAFRAGMEAYI